MLQYEGYRMVLNRLRQLGRGVDVTKRPWLGYRIRYLLSGCKSSTCVAYLKNTRCMWRSAVLLVLKGGTQIWEVSLENREGCINLEWIQLRCTWLKLRDRAGRLIVGDRRECVVHKCAARCDIGYFCATMFFMYITWVKAVIGISSARIGAVIAAVPAHWED